MSCYSQDRLGWLSIVTTAASTMFNWYTTGKKQTDTAFANKLVSNQAEREAAYMALPENQDTAAIARAARTKKILTIGGVIVGGLIIGKVLTQ
jgi:hypothetical protein